MNRATIIIRQLEIICVIGCGEAERSAPQRIELDVDLEYDIKKAASTDDINAAVNYFFVTKRLTELCQERKFFLVEALAAECCEMIFLEWPQVSRIKIQVRKIRIIPEAAFVGIILEKSRQELE